MRLIEAERVAARLAPWRWAWAEENASTIAAHWARRRAERPAMFDGRVLMVAEMRHAAGTLEATFFETGYANLIAWMDSGFPGERVWNGFATGAMRGRDGAFLLGRMAPHTAHAGMLYFPCGTPDLSDVKGEGRVDLAGSIAREIGEETGLGAQDYDVEPGWTIVEDRGLLAFMRGVRLRGTAGEARARIQGFLAGQERPELAAIEIVAGPDGPLAADMPGFVPVYMRHALARGGGASRPQAG